MNRHAHLSAALRSELNHIPPSSARVFRGVHVVLPEEDAAGFQALAAALVEELAPVGALQAVLAQRIAVAAWRLMRADRIEADVLRFQGRDGDLGLAVIRDANGAGALPTLLRYRGSALAEFMRSLRALKTLQAEARAYAGAAAAARAPAPAPVRPAAVRPAPAAERPDWPAARAKQPDEPERRGNLGQRGRSAARVHPGVTPAGVWSVPLPMPGGPALRELEGTVPEISMAQGMDVGVAVKRVP
jgi:hypothetical protein